MEAPSSLGQSSRWFVMFCRPSSCLLGSSSFTACSQPSHPFSSPYLQALPCLVSSRKVLAPTGANFPRVASLHERVVLISFVVLPRVRPVPREAVIQKHRRAPGSQSHHSLKVCALPCESLRDGSSGEPFCWTGPSLLTPILDLASSAPASYVSTSSVP